MYALNGLIRLTTILKRGLSVYARAILRCTWPLRRLKTVQSDH